MPCEASSVGFREDCVTLDWSDAKQRVRQAVDIVELIGDYLQLRREGRGYKALCPWHDDSRPSLQINPERQSFKCWVCDIGGDVFSFVMKQQGVDFREALQFLADRAGIKLEPRRSDGGSSGDEKRDLLQVLSWAEQRFHAFLMQSPEAEPARLYLEERGITRESLETFHCGYSPNRWDWLVEQARQTQFSPKLLLGSGLVAERSNGPGVYDRFRGRVLFSIRDPLGRPVGFGGRVLPGISDDSPAKYVNSPETPLFQKSGLLYALDVAKDAIQRTGTAIVVEGYTDVIIAHQCGFKNTVAVLGTALGERHIKLLRRYAERIVLMLDGDEAGQRRTAEVLELFIACDADLRILTLPGEQDPAEFLLSHPAEELQRRIDTAPDALEFQYRTLIAGVRQPPSVHDLSRVAKQVLELIAKGSRGMNKPSREISLREQAAVTRLGQFTRIPEESLRREIAGLRREMQQSPARSAANPASAAASPTARKAEPPDNTKSGKAERFLMEIVVCEPEHLAEVRRLIGVDALSHPVHQAIFDMACQLSEDGVLPDFDRLMIEFDDAAIKRTLVDLDEGRRAKARTATQFEIQDLANVLRERSGADHSPSPVAAEELPPSFTSEERSDDLARLQRLLQRERDRQGISVPTEG